MHAHRRGQRLVGVPPMKSAPIVSPSAYLHTPTTLALSKRLSSVTSAIEMACLDSVELLKGQKAIEIKHNGSVYRLQTTKLGKLILTK